MAAGTVVAGRWELFVTALAHRIARFPAAGQVAIKERINAITLAPADDFRRDSDLFGEQVHTAEAQRLIQTAMQRGLQTRDAEMELAGMLSDLGEAVTPLPRRPCTEPRSSSCPPTPDPGASPSRRAPERSG